MSQNIRRLCCQQFLAQRNARCWQGAIRAKSAMPSAATVPEPLTMETAIKAAVASQAASTTSDRFRARELRMAKKRSLDHVEGLRSLADHLDQLGLEPMTRASPTIIQVNIGLTCNLACHHCHVESSPVRSETLAEVDAERILELLAATPTVNTLDVTGGAPEMHKAFKRLVTGARSLGIRVIDRCNLTILSQPSFDWVEPFLAEQGVDIVASMPCYQVENVTKQRGEGVFDASIAALKRLNDLGYGVEDSGLSMDLVYNPGGAFLPPDQSMLEAAYKREMRNNFGIEFNNLFCITNMPVKRFADDLRKAGKLAEYMDLLVTNFNGDNVDNAMCRSMVHVSHDGTISDCDFNYALGLPSRLGARSGVSIHNITSFADMADQKLNIGKHCWGCVAGAGSS